MTAFEAVVQGIIQGLTEFLPISSSGHLALFRHFLGLTQNNALFFSVMLHVGTLIAVFVAFWPTILGVVVEFFKMVGDVFRGKFRWKEMNEARSMAVMIIIATLPLAIVYFVKDYVEGFSTDNDIVVEGVCFLITGLLLFFAARRPDGKKTAVDMSPASAVLIGVVQGVATMPGISRSGSTVSTGMLCGFSRNFMVSFSFILGVPAVFASSVFEFKDVLEAGAVGDPLPIVIGMVSSAVAGFFAIKLIQWLVKNSRFKIFAYYLLILGVVTSAVGIIEKF